MTFEDGKYSITLQHLAKGIKDTYNSQVAELSLGLKGIKKEDLENLEDNIDKIPDSMAKVVAKLNELEYFLLSHAIKEWSDKETAVSIDTVKELDEEVFLELIQEVNSMNGLTKQARKN